MIRNSNPSKLFKDFILSFIAGIVIFFYIPTLNYWAYRAGFTEKAKLEDLEIVMNDGWYPERLIDSHWLQWVSWTDSRIPRGLTFRKVKGIWPGWVDTMYFQRMSMPAESLLAKRKDAISHSTRLSWGVVYMIRMDKLPIREGAPDNIVTIAPEFSLMISPSKEERLQDIISVKKLP